MGGPLKKCASISVSRRILLPSIIERCGWFFGTPASYLEGLRFMSRPRYGCPDWGNSIYPPELFRERTWIIELPHRARVVSFYTLSYLSFTITTLSKVV